MKEVTIISGKGGTGKTSLTAALATAGQNLVLCDSDVDAADLHLIMRPEVLESYVFEGAWEVSINPDLCTDCGICNEYCRFNAITLNNSGGRSIDPFKCEGCRLCERICPSKAIHSVRSTSNNWFISDTRSGKMVHASMGPGEENSGKLVTQVRKTAKEQADKIQAEYILTDGPPGTGCSTIASITGTDLVLLVLEPSKSSLHDALRVVELVNQFKIPMCAIINKYDIHLDMTRSIEMLLDEKSITLLGKIPFEKLVVQAMVEGMSISEYDPESEISMMIQSTWNQITELLNLIS